MGRPSGAGLYRVGRAGGGPARIAPAVIRGTPHPVVGYIRNELGAEPSHLCRYNKGQKLAASRIFTIYVVTAAVKSFHRIFKSRGRVAGRSGSRWASGGLGEPCRHRDCTRGTPTLRPTTRRVRPAWDGNVPRPVPHFTSDDRAEPLPNPCSPALSLEPLAGRGGERGFRTPGFSPYLLRTRGQNHRGRSDSRRNSRGFFCCPLLV